LLSRKAFAREAVARAIVVQQGTCA